MSNVSLSLVVGYPVEVPEVRPRASSPTVSFGDLLDRLGRSIYAARRRKIEGEIGDFIERNGGMITDDIERQIGRRYGF